MVVAVTGTDGYTTTVYTGTLIVIEEEGDNHQAHPVTVRLVVTDLYRVYLPLLTRGYPSLR